MTKSKDPATREFASHLMAVGSIRSSHDARYLELLPDEEVREDIEQLDSPNLLQVKDVSELPAEHQPSACVDLFDQQIFDPRMRSVTLDGEALAELPADAELGEALQSQMCRTLFADALFSDAVLLKAQALVQAQLDANQMSLTDEVLTAWLATLGDDVYPREGSADAEGPRKLPRKLLGKLIKVAFDHRRLKATKDDMNPRVAERNALLKERAADVRGLWRLILRRTDQMYMTYEYFEPALRQVATKIMEEVGLPVVLEGGGASGAHQLLKIGGLKDPVRVYEKSMSDYYFRFTDGLAEANVVDIMRCRMEAVCPKTLPALVRTIYSFAPGDAAGAQLRQFEVQLPGAAGAPAEARTAELRLIRSKNKHSTLDPTHFRHFNFVLELRLVGSPCKGFLEVQTHHRDILALNEELHAHDHYNYFRSLLAETYDTGLDVALAKLIAFLTEVTSVPVLLSMLVLIFSTSEGEDAHKIMERVPENRFHLYKKAVAGTAKRNFGTAHAEGGAQRSAPLAHELLRRIAAHCERSVGREFDGDDLLNALTPIAERLTGAARELPVPSEEPASDFLDFVFAEMKEQRLLEVLGSAPAAGEDVREVAQRLFRTLQVKGAEGGALEVPLIKTLKEAIGDEPATYQFKHLSFQESLFAQVSAIDCH